jgi:transposase-like protein
VTTPAERRRILRRWAESGLSAHDFAPVVGVPASTLYSWRRRDRGPTPAFVELALAPEPAADSGAAPPIEVALPRGIVLRIAAGFDPDTLRRAVDALLA